MAKTTIKQHDITDCGAACLASIAAHYNLQIPIARIRQFAGTDKKRYDIGLEFKQGNHNNNIL